MPPSSVQQTSPPRTDRPERTGEPEVALLHELSDAAREMHASLSLDEVLEILADRARRLVGARRSAAIHAMDEDESAAATATSCAESDQPCVTLPPFARPGPWHDVRTTNRSIRMTRHDIEVEPRWAQDLAEPTDWWPTRDWLGAPLIGPDGRNIGTVQLVDKLDGAFTAGDEAVLLQLARMASVAVENARLYRAAVDARAKLGWAAHIERIHAAELRAVIEAIAEGVVVFDRDANVSLTNPAADALFGDRPITTLDDLRARFDPAPATEELDKATELRLRGARNRWLELRLYAIAAPRRRGSGTELGGRIAVLRDVTTARNERAQREAFLGILSHELRTPITTVYAGSKVLARDVDLSPERQELAADVAAEAERLFRLVEDLLVMTRFERGALELAREPVLLQRVVPAAIRLEQVHWPAARISRSGPVDLPAVTGDALYVGQVVRNLLSNAAKYSPPNSVVEVDLAEEDDGVAVRVLDRGGGFSSGEAEDLFELFYRSPSTAAQASGAGIGLFVCRRLILAMGGRIWARPRNGGGAEFGFWLPRYRDAD